MRSSTFLSVALAATALAAPTILQIAVTLDDGVDAGPFHFTSQFNVVALPDQVRNGTEAVPGAAEATGYFNYGINSETDTICYNITLINVVGDFESPATTATHIHEAAQGASGPPRIAFPNPVGDDTRKSTAGCLTGPFTTGIVMNGADTGAGFTVKQIEANPAGFFTDSHTALFPIGVVRGQLS
ncbi:hypothetical protein BJ875DRAFT_406343 [Amylocarpus encephaloides]|uniref:CHRD domain-containing protein n=1 Tax=Amylocarpus encephaloides TaxID=45428 RepID=A0A9P8C374_9HELO|nr:hypothetical protein BJ875DRAFT_406343 [Amylocarpus encephaloides]